jgi:eukaryotic-like serine/threonine-protein kinase
MEVPRLIGRYPVSGVIGTGAFSAVYRAIDERLGSEVAIKLLGDHHSLDPDIRERFIAEARLLRRVSSPHVVRLYELDETDRHQPYLVLELVPGGNLSTHRRLMVGRGLTVTSADVSIVAAAVTEALTALHGERIVHRDLSPSNLLLRRGCDWSATPDDGLIAPDEQLVLADLGLSKDLAVSSGLTAAAGTDGFAAPEQRAGGVVDERTDVFAASALLIWLILGRAPKQSDASDFAAAGWPRDLTTVLAAGLSEAPHHRPGSIVSWHQAVVTALQPPPPPPPPPEVSEPQSGARRRRWLVPGAIAVVLAGSAGYGTAVLTDGDGDGEDPSSATITELADGTVRVQQTDGGVTAAFEGPATLVVGELATFRADVEGAETWFWLGQGGQVIPDTPDLNVTPTSPGTLVISLVAAAPAGDAVVAEMAIPVSDDTVAS